jgi:hypothetical protein
LSTVVQSLPSCPQLFRLTVLAAPHATFRDLRRLMLQLWLDCGCGHLCGFSRLAEPMAGPWPRHAETRRQPSAERLGDVLWLRGEQLRHFYDMGSGTSVTIEVKETSASLNSVAAAWLGSCPLAAGLRNAHPGTVQLCRCGQPGRYLGRSGPRCSKACAAEAGEEPARLVRWWNSPRMGACGYCGPDGVTPDSFWPAEPEFENSEGSEGGSGSENDDSDGEEGGSVVSGISWGAAEGVDGGDAAAQQAEVAAPPAAHAALVEPAAEQAAALGTEQQQEQQQEHRKRSAPSGAEDAAEQPPLQRRRNEAAVEGQAGAAAAAAAGACCSGGAGSRAGGSIGH